MSQFAGESVQSEPYDESVINTIRGKSLVMPPEIGKDIRTLCRMLDWLAEKLDADDGDEAWSEEGWRHRLGIPEDDE